MNELIVLGTGNAAVTACFNTCFALREGDEYLLVDAGGGNGILTALQKQGISVNQIHHIFLTHNHSDHILGMVWMIRMVGTAMNKGTYEGELHIYGHKEAMDAVKTIAGLTVWSMFTKYLDSRMLFHELEDGQSIEVLGRRLEVFDIRSTKAKQFGFRLEYQPGKHLFFPGDEPCQEHVYDLARGCEWMCHEAFCLYADRERFKPYEKHHSTARDAAALARQLGVKNLILWHTEDKTLSTRKETYTREGKAVFDGNLLVPEDGEWILL